MKHVSHVMAILALASCQSSRAPIAASSPSAPVVGPPSTVAQVIASPAPPALPLDRPELPSVVVEGACKELGVSFFDNAAMVHYGDVPDSRFGDDSRLVLAFVRDDGTVDEDKALARGVPASSYPPLDLGAVGGTWPTTASLELFSHGGERVEAESDRYVRKDDRWVLVHPVAHAPAPDHWVSGTSWLRGSTLEPVSEGPAPYPEFRVLPSGAAPTPNFTAIHVSNPPNCQFEATQVVTRPSGELLLAGLFCGIFPIHEDELHGNRGEAAVASWAPGRPARIEPIPAVAPHEDLHLQDLLETSPTSLYLFGSLRWEQPYIAFYDGSVWSRVETPFQGYVTHHELEADGTLWVVTSTRLLYSRAPSGTWTSEPLSEVRDVSWSKARPAWAVASGEVVHRDARGSWTKVTLPRPAFTATDAAFTATNVSVSPKGEVWVVASYEEHRPEWTVSEPREAVLRIGAPVTATRCEKAKTTSFARWPAPATAACTDVVALLARVSKSAPAGYDFPQTRAALRGHTEVEGADLMEIEIDGKRLLAAKVASMDVGKKLVEIEGRGVKGTRPELVCTKPKVTRELAFDWQTGKLRAKAHRSSR